MRLNKIGIVFQILIAVLVAIIVAFLIFHFTSAPRSVHAPVSTLIVPVRMVV